MLCPQTALAPPNRRRNEIEDLDDRRPQGSDRVRGSARDVIGHPSTLPIGDVREGDEGRGARDGVALLHGIADCVDVGIVRLVRVVHRDATVRSELQTCCFGESHVRPHPDRTDDEVSRKDAAIAEGHASVLHRRDRRSGLDVHPVGDQLVLDEDGELGIERRQHLRRRLDDRDVDALPDEVLGHLESDEPGADHDRSRGRDVDVGHETRPRLRRSGACGTARSRGSVGARGRRPC